MSGSGQGIFSQLTKLPSATADSDTQVGLGIRSSRLQRLSAGSIYQALLIRPLLIHGSLAAIAKMRRLLTILLFISLSKSAFGQIFNSMSSDRSGMYYYAVDTLIRSLKEMRKIDRIIIRADPSITQIFPDTILGVSIIRHSTGAKHKRSEINKSHVVLAVSGVSIVRDQFTISILAVERTKDGIPYIGNGSYKYYFTYDPETMTYSLSKIKSGIIL